MKEKPFVPQEELARQREFVREIGEAFAGRKTYHIVTLGCQMNVRDSETLAGTLQEMGFAQAERTKPISCYNTCCGTGKNAENRALGNVIWLKELKKERPDMVIGVCGCMIQEEGVAERLQKQYPFIDLRPSNA